MAAAAAEASRSKSPPHALGFVRVFLFPPSVPSPYKKPSTTFSHTIQASTYLSFLVFHRGTEAEATHGHVIGTSGEGVACGGQHSGGRGPQGPAGLLPMELRPPVPPPARQVQHLQVLLPIHGQALGVLEHGVQRDEGRAWHEA